MRAERESGARELVPRSERVGVGGAGRPEAVVGGRSSRPVQTHSEACRRAGVRAARPESGKEMLVASFGKPYFVWKSVL